MAREIVKTVESGIPQNFARTRRRTRKGAVAAAADDENGDELPAAPARNAAEALRAKADLARLTVLKEVDPELKENAVHEQAAKWGVQLKTSTTREEGYTPSSSSPQPENEIEACVCGGGRVCVW